MSNHDDDWFPTEEELKKIRPIDEVDSALLKAHHEGSLRGPGRPPKANKKVPLSIRIEPEILEAFKATGTGWQSLMNNVLKDWADNNSTSGLS